MTLDDRGKVLKLDGENSLPLLLGDLALLVIEPLPEKREKTWQVDYGLAVVEKKKTSNSRIPHRPSRLHPEQTTATARPWRRAGQLSHQGSLERAGDASQAIAPENLG